MRAVLHLLLLFGLLFGLAAQGAALAAEPCPMEHAQSSAFAGMEDCHPEGEATDHGGAPCKDMTLACVAMAGGAPLAALGPDAIKGLVTQTLEVSQFWILAPALHGRTIPPDTHPPARLG